MIAPAFCRQVFNDFVFCYSLTSGPDTLPLLRIVPVV